MQPVSIIACNNGLGHIKRCFLIYNELVELGINVTIFGNSDRIHSFAASRGHTIMPVIQNVEGLPSGQDYVRYGLGSFKDVFQNLGELLKDSLVISDNYYEPFLNGENGFLLANFLWSDLQDENLGFDIVRQLNDKNCTILTTEFGKPYFKKAVKINLFGPPAKQQSSSGYTLVCKGFGDWSGGFEKRLEVFFENEIKCALDGLKPLYLDKNISYLECFSNYDVKFLDEGITTDIIAGADRILGRPSVGIVTDSLALKVPFLPVYAPDDRESAHNASVLSKLYRSNGITSDHLPVAREQMEYLDCGLRGESQLAKLVYRELTK